MARLFSFVVLIVGAVVLLASAASERPPVTPHTPLGDDVDITLSIQGYDGEGMELELKEGPRGGDLFLRFQIDPRQGHAVLRGAGPRKQVDEMRALPDLPFLSRGGAPVLDHRFRNQLVETADGEVALRVQYTNSDTSLLRAVRVARNTTFPPFLSQALGHDGPIQLLRGTYPIEEDGAATIEVRLLGR